MASRQRNAACPPELLVVDSPAVPPDGRAQPRRNKAEPRSRGLGAQDVTGGKTPIEVDEPAACSATHLKRLAR